MRYILYIQSENKPYIVKDFGKRLITHAFHDIDGTHSLIRDWVPVMSITLAHVIKNGLSNDFDSESDVERLVKLSRNFTNEETDKFCIESAGLSALTQMEWAIRRAVEEGTLNIQTNMAVNSGIIQRIWSGEEVFDDFNDSAELKACLKNYTPRLFKFYESILNRACRDENLEKARLNPSSFMVSGSMEFMTMLCRNGVKNYFVTGAVVEKGMGMHEEVEALGYKIGNGCVVDGILGSTWNEKIPKNVVMQRLLKELEISGENVLVVGDGRSEISAGVQMNAVCISRLPENAIRQRELHKQLGTNIIVSDFKDDFLNMFQVN